MAAPPKKVLVAAGQALHDIERAAQHRIAVGKPKLHWAALIAREKDMIKDIPENLARAMARSSVEVTKGHCTFAGPDSVRVGDRTLRAGHIVIAAGSKPRPLPIPGAKHTVTSDDMLREGRRPESIIFIGGGAISLEFGHVYARAGSSVTILEALPQLLPAMDADAVARLQTQSERIGLQISTGVRIERIEATGERFRVIFTHEGTEKTVEAGSSMARVVSPMSRASRSPLARSITTTAASLPTTICAQPPIHASMSEAMSFQPRLSYRLSRLMKVISSFAISLMDRSTARTTRALRPRSTRFPRLPLSA